MKSSDKFRIVAKPMSQYDGKHWIVVTPLLPFTEWILSFEDLFRIIQGICWCEDRKYPRGEGRKMVVRFLGRCCETDIDWEALKAEFDIPGHE